MSIRASNEGYWRNIAITLIEIPHTQTLAPGWLARPLTISLG